MRVTLLLWGHSHGFYEVNGKIWFIMIQYNIQEYTHSHLLTAGILLFHLSAYESSISRTCFPIMR